MDQEEKNLLKKTFALAEENNRMLKKVRGTQNRETVFRVIKYVLIIGLALGSFYFLEPYLNSTADFYKSLTGQNTNQGAEEEGVFDSFIEKFQ